MKNKDIISRMRNELSDRAAHSLYRALLSDSGLIDFCSNDYLGLAKISMDSNLPHGATGSRLISGNTIHHESAEAFIAEFHDQESALLFNSGYTANVGFFSTVPKRGDVIIYDELIHASIRDGIRLSNARNHSFKHNDLEGLKTKLKKSQETTFVVVESLYSMDGDKAPLKGILELCDQYGAYLIVDEAHSVGLYGKEGAGILNELGIHRKVFARIITYGKAFGFHGAAILGDKTLKEYLINYCRSFIYTTAISPHDTEILLKKYEWIRSSELMRNQLWNNVRRFSSESEDLSPIQTVIVPGNQTVQDLTDVLRREGFDVRAVKSPTVPEGQERIRVCIHSYNSMDDIDKLNELLKFHLMD